MDLIDKAKPIQNETTKTVSDENTMSNSFNSSILDRRESLRKVQFINDINNNCEVKVIFQNYRKPLLKTQGKAKMSALIFIMTHAYSHNKL